MNNKQNYEGDVGVVVNGKARFLGPHASASNVVNIVREKDEALLSPKQQQLINIRAKELSALTGENMGAIYGRVMKRFDTQRIAELPARKVSDFLQALEAEIALANGPHSNNTPISRPRAARPRAAIPQAVDRSPAKWGRFLLLALAMLGGAVWWFGLRPVGAQPQADAVDACLYDGKQHSIGSVVEMAGNKYACQIPVGGGDAVWSPLPEKTARKPKHRRPPAAAPASNHSPSEG